MTKRPKHLRGDWSQRARNIVLLAAGEIAADPAPTTTASEAGKKGGRARAEKLSAAERSRIAKVAAAKRWRK